LVDVVAGAAHKHCKGQKAQHSQYISAYNFLVVHNFMSIALVDSFGILIITKNVLIKNNYGAGFVYWSNSITCDYLYNLI